MTHSNQASIAASHRHHRRHVGARPGARRSVRRARRRRRLRRPRRDAGPARRRGDRRQPRHRRRRRQQDRHPRHRAADRRRARRPRRADQQRLEPRPGAAGAARRHRVRGLRARARDQPARPVSPHQGAARRARRGGARRRAATHRSLVVNVTSDAAVTPYAGWGAYGASKAALAHMSRIWHEELAPHGVAVIAVDPGDMDTPLHAAARARCRPGDAEAAARRGARDRRADRPRAPRATRQRARAIASSGVKAATMAVQRPRDARLLVVDAAGRIAHHARADLAALLVPGDLVVANDAATLPASLAGRHVATGAPIEVRLAGRRSLAVDDVRVFSAVVFGAGDFRTRTEDRAPPPPLRAGDVLALGPLRRRSFACSTIRALVELSFAGDADRHPRRHRPPRPAGAVRARRRAARALGRVDAGRGAAGRVRAAVGRVRPRLAAARSTEASAASASRR